MTPELRAPRHGGDLAFASARYGEPPGGWLDLSTGINPQAYPIESIAAPALAALPDRAALDRLVATAREAYGAPPEAALIAIPGSEIAIRLLPFILPDGPVAIVGPTYGSHAEAWAMARRCVVPVDRLDDVPADAVAVVLANPNNPDGRVFDVARLGQLAAALSRRGGALVVDEAFADLYPDNSLVPRLHQVPAIVLRSFGKFFGLAGLRLGFVVGSIDSIGRLGSLLGDWPVSTPALIVGQAALADNEWQAETRQRLRIDAALLRALLEQHRLGIAGGTDLFVLAEHTNAARLHVHLAEAGIWTRAFPYRDQWLRFGLPGSDADLDRLHRALATLT